MLSKDSIRFVITTPTGDSFDISFKITKSLKQLKDAIKQKHKFLNPSFKMVYDGKVIEENESKL